MARDTPAVLPIDYDTVHVAATDHRDALTDELIQRGSRIIATHEDLVFSSGQPGPAAWAQNSWLAPREYRIDSIGQAARQLRALQRNWHAHSIVHHRRSQLIADKLPSIRFRPMTFPATLPSAPLGAFCLLERDRLLASPACSSAFADGRPVFVEDRHGPPNRAYLKLWEALTLAGVHPEPGQTCIDLGAAPGGWSWVLAELGANVVAVDRAALTPTLADHPRVSNLRGDAFAVTRDDVPTPDWILSDVIAYPERLRELAEYWCRACPQARIIITVKCQGAVDPAQIAEFLAIPGSRLCHLSANKHELTFFRLPEGGPADGAGTPS